MEYEKMKHRRRVTQFGSFATRFSGSIGLTLVAFALLFLNACSTKNGSSPSSPHSAGGDPFSIQDPKGATPAADGSTSGGGGYGSEPGTYLLNRIRNELVNELESTSDQIFSDVHKPALKQQLIEIIKTLRPDPRSEQRQMKLAIRDGEELYFDNLLLNKKPSIVATRLFYQTHAGFEYSELSEAQIAPKVRFFKVRALHEALHHLGIGVSRVTDHRARAAAEAIFNAMETNNFICQKSTTDMPTSYFRFWQRYRMFDPVFSRYCRSQVEERAAAFYSSERYVPTKASGTRLDWQIQGKVAEQQMAWVVNRPTGKGLFHPNLRIEQQNESSDELNNLFVLNKIRSADYSMLQHHDSDQRPPEEMFPHYRFRSPLSTFGFIDTWAQPPGNGRLSQQRLDWKEVKSSGPTHQVTYSAADKATALVVKAKDPITTLESSLCDTQVFYESRLNQLKIDQGDGVARFDLEVKEQLEIKSDDSQVRGRLKFEQWIGGAQDFHLGPWQGAGTQEPQRTSGAFDLKCDEFWKRMDPALFAPDRP